MTIAPIGELGSVCPKCASELPRRPGRKTVCPACLGTIHVRTRAYDGQRVLVTPDQAEELERQWEAFMEFKYDIRQMAVTFPELQPLFEDLHTGRMGAAPVDWENLELIVSQPIGPCPVPEIGKWFPVLGGQVVPAPKPGTTVVRRPVNRAARRFRS